MTPPPKTEKLYCYVDETGQDTMGRLFLVVLVLTAGQRDQLAADAERIEAQSLKGTAKWKDKPGPAAGIPQRDSR